MCTDDPDRACCEALETIDISSACSEEAFEQHGWDNPAALCFSDCASQIRAVEDVLVKNSESGIFGFCAVILHAYAQLELTCLQNSDKTTYCLKEVTSVFDTISNDDGTPVNNAAISTSVRQVCDGGKESCPVKLARMSKKLFDVGVVASSSITQDDEPPSGWNAARIIEQVNAFCLPAEDDQYCVPLLAD